MPLAVGQVTPHRIVLLNCNLAAQTDAWVEMMGEALFYVLFPCRTHETDSLRKLGLPPLLFARTPVRAGACQIKLPLVKIFLAWKCSGEQSFPCC